MGNTISVFNPKKQFIEIRSEIKKAIDRVFKNGNFILGQEVKKFEQEFAKYLGVKYCFGVASGTDALTIALKALDVASIDEVIIPVNAYPTAFGVALAGSKIVLCDIDSRTFNIDTKLLPEVITKKTKVIIPVHLYGQPADLAPIIDIARKHNIFIVEDVAQAHGAKYLGKKVGTLGEIGCFSFYPTKNLGAYGDGGAIVTKSEKLAKKIKLLRTYGEKDRYNSVIVGLNSRLDELQAAILRVKLKHLDNWNRKREEIAKIYDKELNGLPITLPYIDKNIRHVYHQYVIRIKKRDELRQFLANNGCETLVHYPTPIHLQKTFSKLGASGDFKVSEIQSHEILSLPIYPELKKEEILHVCHLIRQFFKR